MLPPPVVYIVGAGPGDPSLLTARGRECIERADVIVYDHRVPAPALQLARPDAERIDVGATAPTGVEHDAISMLLVEKAREGKVVVRLRLGDPYLFDGAAGEALFLRQQGVPFETVPGVPVSLAGPAYAGVPLTFPGSGDAVLLVRGSHPDSDELPRLDWAHAARVDGTFVCFSGPRQLAAISRTLLANGRSPSEPAVLISDATTPRQRTRETTLRDVPALAAEGGPALLVVGVVAALRPHLRWFDSRPLFGRRVVVTRSREQAGELTRGLEELGAEVVALPSVRTVPPSDPSALDEACDNAHRFDWLVFTSANGVRCFMRRFLGRRDIRDLHGLRICTVGPSTAAVVAEYGLRVDVTPAEYRSEGVVTALRGRDVGPGTRILLPRSGIARELLADELRATGAAVDDVAAYTTEPAGEAGHDIYRMLLDGEIDAVTFTSASTVRNFVQMLGAEQAPDLLRHTVLAAIGPVTAEAAAQLGLAVTVVPAQFTVPALIDALVHHFTLQPATTAEAP